MSDFLTVAFSIAFVLFVMAWLTFFPAVGVLYLVGALH